MQNFQKTAQQARAATNLPHPVQYPKFRVWKMEMNKEEMEGMKHRWQQPERTVYCASLNEKSMF